MVSSRAILFILNFFHSSVLVFKVTLSFSTTFFFSISLLFINFWSGWTRGQTRLHFCGEALVESQPCFDCQFTAWVPSRLAAHHAAGVGVFTVIPGWWRRLLSRSGRGCNEHSAAQMPSHHFLVLLFFLSQAKASQTISSKAICNFFFLLPVKLFLYCFLFFYQTF